MSHRSQVIRAAWITARDLVGGLLVGIALGGALNEVAKSLPVPMRRGISALAAVSVLAFAGGLWGRHMARLAGAANARRAAWTAGLAFGPSTVLVGLSLAALEPVLVPRGAGVGLAIHVVYTMLFAPATLVVAAAGGFALGLGIRGLRLGASLAARAGLSAALAFLVVDVLMDTLGWRVGGPDAGRRATMLVVTALGATGAALAAGTTIGHRLLRGGSEASSSPAAT
jgi:hypothetical protein